MTLTPMDLVGQFILCRTKDAVPEGWHVRHSGDWYLGTHPALPVVDILGADSSWIGWLLGWAISPEGHLVKESVQFDIASHNACAADQFEFCLYEYGGRFSGVCLLESSQRFYLDPIGSLAAVYCASQSIVASTPTLIPLSSDTAENSQFVRQMGIPERDPSWCPLGTTPRRNVERVLPNHFVDLQNWQTVRHWPTGDIPTTADVSSAVGELVGLLKRNISALAQEHMLHMSLTAGRDTRMLLACARDHSHTVNFVTLRLDASQDRVGQTALDCRIAKRIARACDLDHVLLHFRELSSAELEQWLFRTGGCTGLAASIRSVYGMLDKRRLLLHGAAGELGRGFHWRPGDTESSRIHPNDLLAKRGIPFTPAIEQRARRWLDGLRVTNALTIWGLLYNEEFNGCWLAPRHYGVAPYALRICPFSHQRLVEIMLSLPTDYRRANRLPEDVLRREWPQLLKLPFNWPIGIRRYVHAVQWRWKRLSGLACLRR